jgi:hypothetical protein
MSNNPADSTTLQFPHTPTHSHTLPYTTGARPIIQRFENKKIFDVNEEFRTDFNVSVRDVDFRILLLRLSYFGTGTCTPFMCKWWVGAMTCEATVAR